MCSHTRIAAHGSIENITDPLPLRRSAIKSRERKSKIGIVPIVSSFTLVVRVGTDLWRSQFVIGTARRLTHARPFTRDE